MIYFHKKIVFFGAAIVLVLFISVLICMTGMSNLDGSFGVPTMEEVRLLESMKYREKSLPKPLHVTEQNTPMTIALVLPLSKDEEMKSRLHRVESLCKKYHLGNYKWPNETNSIGVKDPPTQLYAYFFHNREHKLAWCPVYKAGSTTWLYNMMILKGYPEKILSDPPKQLSVLAEEVYNEDAKPGAEFDQAVKLLVVRHPFERIVSAYRDKLSNSTIGVQHGSKYYHDKYGKMIVKKFRTNWRILQAEPTFQEFVRYLIKTDLSAYADDHWLPAYSSCTPCLVSYNYIAKVETYMEDQKFIIENLGLSNILRPRWHHRSSLLQNATTSHPKTDIPSATASKYFSQITKSQIINLFQKYRLDFELFGYSYENYVPLGKDTVKATESK